MASSAIWTAGSTAIGLPALVVSTILVARYLGVAEFGRYAYYSYVTALVSGLCDLGFGASLIRRGAIAFGAHDEAGLLAASRASATWSLMQLPWTLGVGWVVLPSTRSVLIYSAGVLLYLAFQGPSHYLTMTSSLRFASVTKALGAFVGALCSIVVAYHTRSAALTFAVGTLGTNLPMFLQTFAVPRRIRRSTLLPGRVHVTRREVSFGFTTLLNTQLNGFVFSRSEVLFFGPVQSIARGRFSAAQTIAARSTLLVDALFGALPAGLSAAAGRNAAALVGAFELVSDATVLMLTGAAPVLTVVAVVLGPALFGAGFGSLGWLVLVMTLSSTMQSGLQALLALRFAMGNVKPLLLVGVAAAALDALLAALLVPRIGAWGAVIANGASGAAYFVITAATFASDAEWARPTARHLGRTVAVCAFSALIAAPFANNGVALGLGVGLPLAALGSIALSRTSGIALSEGGLTSVLDAMPARLSQGRIGTALVRLLAGNGR